MVAQTRTVPALQSLKFKDKLIGKTQSSDILLKKVKALHAELSMMDQETVDTRSLATVSKDLIHQSVFLHRDKGVKAYAACCMADLLRLYAPDAPYTALELKDMFQFFFRQLSTGLKGADAPWFAEYVYLLESMATIKTVCLVPDLPHGDELTAEIFREFFDLVKLDLSKKVELFMADILVALVEESPGLPSGVLDILLSQFASKNARMDHPAYRLAVDVCKATSDKLQGPVAQYFTDIISQHRPDEDEDEELDDIKASHDLVIQLHRSCPALLNAVVPQLGEELAVDNERMRILATRTLGNMFAFEPNVATKYPATWKSWFTRSRDKSANVRVTFVEELRSLMSKHNSVSAEVEQALDAKMLDGDDKVRAAVCKVYAHLDYETALHYVSAEQLKRLADRMLDTKHAVRNEAFTAIGRLYRLAYPEIEANEPAAIRHFAWIPSQIIHVISTTADLDVRSTAEQTLSKYILPLPKGDDEVAWTEQLVVTARHLDHSKLAALIVLSNIGLSRPTLLARYVQCCEAYNGGVIDEDEKEVTVAYNSIIAQLSRRFPDHVKASEDLQAFGKLNEARLYKLMTSCLDPQVDLKALTKNMNEFSRRLEQTSSDIHTTMMGLIRRNSLHMINTSSVPTLVKHIQRQDKYDLAATNSARTILVAVAKQCPAIFRSHVAEFCRALSEEGNVPLVEVSLQALAAVARWDENGAPNDKRTLDRVARFARSNNAAYAKFSTRLLAHSKKKDEFCSALCKDITSELNFDDETLLEAHLCCVAELAKSAPDSFEESSDQIITFLLKDILSISPDEIIEEEEWVESEAVPLEARLKILALKTCVNRCTSHASLPSAEDVFKPVMRMLFAILDNMGSTKPDFADHAQVKARLRLRAATSLLKLSTNRKFSRLITTHFPQLALMMQDQSFQVRSNFLNKLIGHLQSRQLDPRYNMVLFMTALDPEDEIRSKASGYAKMMMSRLPPELRLAQFEMPLPRLLHLLAVHPDFSLELEALKDISDYLDLYMDLVLTSENIHLLTFLAQKTKSIRVIDSHTLSENLYAISELAQHKIRTRAVRRGWATNAYPGQITLPSDIFKALPSPEIANKIQRTVYLSEDKIQWLDQHAKVSSKPARPAKPRKPRATAGARKRKSPNVRQRRLKKRRKDTDVDDDEPDESDTSDDDPIEDGDEPLRAPSSARTIDEDDVEMPSSEAEAERPRRNAPRNARPRATKKKRFS